MNVSIVFSISESIEKSTFSSFPFDRYFYYMKYIKISFCQ